MIKLNNLPKNKEKFLRLLTLCKKVVVICRELGIEPVINGSLAVFAYSGKQEMPVNDIDMFLSESEFHKVIDILKEKELDYELKDYHVLRIEQDDLKVDLDSKEYWMKDLPEDYNPLEVDGFEVSMVSLDVLRKLYERGLKGTLDTSDVNNKAKHQEIKAKLEVLNKVF